VPSADDVPHTAGSDPAVTILIRKLFRILLDRANKRVQDLDGNSPLFFLRLARAISWHAKMPLYRDFFVWQKPTRSKARSICWS